MLPIFVFPRESLLGSAATDGASVNFRVILEELMFGASMALEIFLIVKTQITFVATVGSIVLVVDLPVFSTSDNDG
jgi:hypothetical protein